MRLKRFSGFASKVAVIHVITYFLMGAIAYQVLTKQFYEGDNALFSVFMRTPSEPELWRHVMIWFIPAQIVRGILMAVVFYPFYDLLIEWTYWKRVLSIGGLNIVLGNWASSVAAPGTIEGMVYLRPEITPYAHLMVQPEIVLQGMAFAMFLGWWMVPKESRRATASKTAADSGARVMVNSRRLN